MYETGDLLPIEEFPGGSVVRVSGPAMVGTHDLAVRLLADGLDRDQACIVLTTDRSAAEIDEELRAAADRDRSGAPVGFVGASGTDEAADDTVETVNSPTDLTGIGMALTEQLEALAGPDLPTRIGVLSLTTLLLYNDPERVMKFLHVLGRRVSAARALAFLVVDEDAIDETTAAQLNSFVDGEIRLREGESGPECRVRGFGPDTEWTPVSPADRPAPGRSAGGGPPPAEPSIDAVADLVDRVEREGSTVTIANHAAEETSLSTIRQYFRRLNVDVRTTTLGTDTPRDVALLHRGADLQAAAPVADLASAVAVADDPEVPPRTTTGLLDAVDRTVFDADGLERRLLVQASRTIEGLALRVGEGRLHAGFQRLSRLVGDERTATVYDRLADSGVDVHVYGRPDTTFEDDRVTVHARTDEELTSTWFVSFVGPDSRAGVLVAIDRGDAYRGFWSYRAALAEELDGYLCARY